MSVPAGAPLSLRSERVKQARKLTRRAVRAERGLFLAEGPQAVREALATPGVVVEVYAAPDRHDELRRAADAAGTPWHDAAPEAVASLSETVTPQGVVAVCHTLERGPRAVVRPGADLIVLCADVRDPGNAGTLARTADAVGADGLLMVGDSVDLQGGKAVRASVGSLFHLPWAVERDHATALRLARDAGLTVLAADGSGEVDLLAGPTAALLRGPVAWLFGNEARGLPETTAAAADHRVRVPIPGRAESLNLATAAAVCLYATLAARR